MPKPDTYGIREMRRKLASGWTLPDILRHGSESRAAEGKAFAARTRGRPKPPFNAKEFIAELKAADKAADEARKAPEEKVPEKPPTGTAAKRRVVKRRKVKNHIIVGFMQDGKIKKIRFERKPLKIGTVISEETYTIGSSEFATLTYSFRGKRYSYFCLKRYGRRGGLNYYEIARPSDSAFVKDFCIKGTQAGQISPASPR
jgi:hypothetical protein